jgi:CheY-like chemotaxis protein
MTILVVDDEPVVRKFIRTILNRHGYKTLEASDGEAALECASQHACDVVVSDFTMPGMSGGELIAELRKRQYPAQYLLISAQMPENAGTGMTFLAKPFTPAQLMGAIERLANQTSPSSGKLKTAALEAREEWLVAVAEQDQLLSEIPTEIPFPDGSLRIQKAGNKRKTAYSKYMEALKAYRTSLRQNGAGSHEPSEPGPKL